MSQDAFLEDILATKDPPDKTLTSLQTPTRNDSEKFIFENKSSLSMFDEKFITEREKSNAPFKSFIELSEEHGINMQHPEVSNESGTLENKGA